MATITDIIAEDNEKFHLKISTLDDRVVEDHENVATVTTVDQDSEWVACGLCKSSLNNG